MRVLYSAGEIRHAIDGLFRASGKRVALVAYVGDGADSYLPSPKGVQLVCCPDGAGTNPHALRRLMRRQVQVEFARKLHMKVYWSRLGAVVTSANLSYNGLGGGTRECGVLLGPRKVDIERLRRSVAPTKVTKAAMLKLDRDYAAKKPYTNTGGTRPPRTKRLFSDWVADKYRAPWKLGWWTKDANPSRNAKRVCQRTYDIPEPEDFISSRRGEYHEGDWVLSFKLDRSGIPKGFDWLYVDFVTRSTTGHDRDYPFEAVQVHQLHRYGETPFVLDGRFRSTFRQAVADMRMRDWKKLPSSAVPRQMMNRLKRFFASSE
jgi:hypothetical protein